MKHIPKQQELDKFVDYLRKRVIHDCKVPLNVKELKAEHHIDPYFKDIVKYLEKDYCRYVGKAQTVFKMQCEYYVLVNGILFRIRYDKENNGEPTLVLCVPEKYVPTVLYQYHTPLLAGHPGEIKLYDTIRQKYYFPGMFNLVREFIECCLECQSMKSKNDGPRIQYARIPLDTRTMARMSMDIKEMPESELGFRNILVCVCEFTSWMKTIPLADQKEQTIAMAIFIVTIWICIHIWNCINTRNLSRLQEKLTFMKFLYADKTDLYMQFMSNYMTWSVYLGSVYDNPEGIEAVSQFLNDDITLYKGCVFDFLTIQWDNVSLSQHDLDLWLPSSLPVSLTSKLFLRRSFDNPKTLFRIIAYNPQNGKVRPNTS